MFGESKGYIPIKYSETITLDPRDGFCPECAHCEHWNQTLIECTHASGYGHRNNTHSLKSTLCRNFRVKCAYKY